MASIFAKRSKPALPADLKGGLVVSVYMPFVLARLRRSATGIQVTR